MKVVLFDRVKTSFHKSNLPAPHSLARLGFSSRGLWLNAIQILRRVSSIGVVTLLTFTTSTNIEEGFPRNYIA